MAVKIADAVIPLVLDLTEFDRQLSEVESRLARIGTQMSAAQSVASSTPLSSPTDAVSRRSFLGLDAFDAAEIALDFIPGSGIGIKGAKAISNIPGAVTKSARRGGAQIGSALNEGAADAARRNKGLLANAMSESVDEAIEAGKRAAEISSPSRRMAREVTGPIMEGAVMGIRAGTPAVVEAMTSSIMFAFDATKARLFGGSHVGPGLNVVANPGGPIGGFLGPLGNSFRAGIDQANPTGPGELSRSILGQFPTGARKFGQGLVEAGVGSLLPAWAAGPASDMIGTFFGTKPIIARDDALAPSLSADAGGFADYPYGGGQYVFNNTFNGGGNFTDTELAVRQEILEAMFRLGIY